MRLFMDSMVALMLAAILAVVVLYNRSTNDAMAQREFARAEVRRFTQQIALQTALSQVQRNERGYPASVDVEWFAGKLPANPLLDIDHPWLEVAGAEQHDLLHPPERSAGSAVLAKFWYNPSNGLVRARVPTGLSDAATLQMYNFINDCELPELFADGSEHR